MDRKKGEITLISRFILLFFSKRIFHSFFFAAGDFISISRFRPELNCFEHWLIIFLQPAFDTRNFGATSQT